MQRARAAPARRNVNFTARAGSGVRGSMVSEGSGVGTDDDSSSVASSVVCDWNRTDEAEFILLKTYTPQQLNLIRRLQRATRCFLAVIHTETYKSEVTCCQEVRIAAENAEDAASATIQRKVRSLAAKQTLATKKQSLFSHNISRENTETLEDVSALKLQGFMRQARSFREVKERKVVHDALAESINEVAFRIEQTHAAKILQRNWTERKRRAWLAKRTAKVRILQRWWRRVLKVPEVLMVQCFARTCLMARWARANFLMKCERIQRCWRVYVACEALRKQRHVVCFGEAARLRQEQLGLLALRRATLVVQRSLRARGARVIRAQRGRRKTQQRNDGVNVVLVQRFCRCALAVMRVRGMWRERCDVHATVVQMFCRSQCSYILAVQQLCAIRIQKTFRGFLSRARLEMARQAENVHVSEVLDFWRDKLAHRRAAVSIQALLRGHALRRKLALLRRWFSALPDIRKHSFRAATAHTAIDTRCAVENGADPRLALVIHAFVRTKQSCVRVARKYAILQNRVRQAETYTRQDRAAVVIQKCARGWLGYFRFLDVQEALALLLECRPENQPTHASVIPTRATRPAPLHPDTMHDQNLITPSTGARKVSGDYFTPTKSQARRKLSDRSEMSNDRRDLAYTFLTTSSFSQQFSVTERAHHVHSILHDPPECILRNETISSYGFSYTAHLPSFYGQYYIEEKAIVIQTLLRKRNARRVYLRRKRDLRVAWNARVVHERATVNIRRGQQNSPVGEMSPPTNLRSASSSRALTKKSSMHNPETAPITRTKSVMFSMPRDASKSTITKLDSHTLKDMYVNVPSNGVSDAHAGTSKTVCQLNAVANPSHHTCKDGGGQIGDNLREVLMGSMQLSVEPTDLNNESENLSEGTNPWTPHIAAGRVAGVTASRTIGVVDIPKLDILGLPEFDPSVLVSEYAPTPTSRNSGGSGTRDTTEKTDVVTDASEILDSADQNTDEATGQEARLETALQTMPEALPDTEDTEQHTAPENTAETETEQETDNAPETVPETEPDAAPEVEPETVPEAEPEVMTETEPASVPEVEQETTPEAEVEPEVDEVNADRSSETALDTETAPETSSAPETEVQTEARTSVCLLGRPLQLAQKYFPRWRARQILLSQRARVQAATERRVAFEHPRLRLPRSLRTCDLQMVISVGKFGTHVQCLQRAVRCMAARKKLTALREAVAEEVVRRMDYEHKVVELEMRAVNCSVLLLQKVRRGVLARAEARKWRRRRLKATLEFREQSSMWSEDCLPRQQSAIIIQQAWKCAAARSELIKRAKAHHTKQVALFLCEHHYAAAAIQHRWRMWIAWKRPAHIPVLQIQCWWRIQTKKRKNRRDKAARLMTRCFKRGVQVLKKRRAVACIQLHWRLHLRRKHRNREISRWLLIQDMVQSAAAVMLQKAWRYWKYHSQQDLLRAQITSDWACTIAHYAYSFQRGLPAFVTNDVALCVLNPYMKRVSQLWRKEEAARGELQQRFAEEMCHSADLIRTQKRRRLHSRFAQTLAALRQNEGNLRTEDLTSLLWHCDKIPVPKPPSAARTYTSYTRRCISSKKKPGFGLSRRMLDNAKMHSRYEVMQKPCGF